MKKALLILIAILSASIAFGQVKSKTTNTIYLYRKADYNTIQYLVPEGSRLDLIANQGEFWEVSYQGKVRYMSQDFKKDVIPVDSIPPPKTIEPRIFPLPMDNTTGRITFTEVVKVDSTTSKEQLYSRAREWFAKSYNSSKDVIQMDDKTSGKIVGKAIFKTYLESIIGPYTSGNIGYTISVIVKDGRYKYEITDFDHQGLSEYSSFTHSTFTRIEPGPIERFLGDTEKAKDQWVKQINDNIKPLIESLKMAMIIPSLIKSKDDW